MPLSLTNSTDVTADVVIANLLVNSEIVTNNTRAKDADFFTVNDNLVVTGTLTVNTEILADQLTVNDDLAVTGTLMVNTAKAKGADQLTVDDNLYAIGDLAADTIRALDADQLTITDNLTVTGALVVNAT